MARLDSEKPDAVILIDYPGFNLRFAKEAKKRNLPVIYYISPQVWAWHKNRIKTIKKFVDKMLVLFEFEKDLYKQDGIDAVFVGHPLIDAVKADMPKQDAINHFGLKPGQTIIAILPGSRKTEVKKILPIMLKSAQIIADWTCHSFALLRTTSEGALRCAQGQTPRPKNLSFKREILRPFGAQNDMIHQIQFILIKSPIVDRGVYDKIVAGARCSVPLRIINNNRYDAIACSDFALVASGTATLETAILGVPMALVYKVSFLTWLLARMLIKIPYIGLVNVVAGKKIIPEFIQFNARPKKIADECLAILRSPTKISQMKLGLARVKVSLGPSGASETAAKEILKKWGLSQPK